jgi:hypothetical protein
MLKNKMGSSQSSERKQTGGMLLKHGGVNMFNPETPFQ